MNTVALITDIYEHIISHTLRYSLHMLGPLALTCKLFCARVNIVYPHILREELRESSIRCMGALEYILSDSPGAYMDLLNSHALITWSKQLRLDIAMTLTRDLVIYDDSYQALEMKIDIIVSAGRGRMCLRCVSVHVPSYAVGRHLRIQRESDKQFPIFNMITRIFPGARAIV